MLRVGTDIVAIDRIEKSINRFGDKFLRRFLTEEEIKLATKIDSFAGFWASKEAISKALGCGIGKELSFLDIQIYKDTKGSPHFILSKKAKKRFQIKESSLSISHDKNFAIAVVVLNL